MEQNTSWEDYTYSEMVTEISTSKFKVADSFVGIIISNVDDEYNDVNCINTTLPDDILEQILGYLPVIDIFSASQVCKKWNELFRSQIFRQNLSRNSPQTPWYFMFNDTNPLGEVYDPIYSRWYYFKIPYYDTLWWTMVSSSGLVCIMDNDISRRKIYVCNPITKQSRRLEEPLGLEDSYYCALAISLDKSSKAYTVTMVRSNKLVVGQLDSNLSIDVYKSDKNLWSRPVDDVTLQGWSSTGKNSVMCGGVLYFVVHVTRIVGIGHPYHGVLAYDLWSESFDVDQKVILAPYPFTCMHLINLADELVMVGGIEIGGCPKIMEAIGIWILRGKQWEQVSRMPDKMFRHFGELDDVFACSGFDSYVYIQGYGSPALLMFDFKTRLWRWSRKCPSKEIFYLPTFTGICFEPRLDLIP